MLPDSNQFLLGSMFFFFRATTIGRFCKGRERDYTISSKRNGRKAEGETFQKGKISIFFFCQMI